MNPEIAQNYQSLADQYQSEYESRKKQLRFISFARLLSFLGIIPAYYYLHPVNETLSAAVAFLLLIAFFFLIKKFIDTEKQMLFFQRLVEINRNEIGALNRNLTPFDPGNEFIDPHHDYSCDLDLYGNSSIFQFLNRTVTQKGKKFLSTLLNKTLRSVVEIENRQAAIQELANELTWRQHFMAKGSESEDHKNQQSIDESIGQIIGLKHERTVIYLPLIFPFLILISTGLYIWGIVPEQIFLIPLFAQWTIYLVFSKTIAEFYKKFESQAKLLNRYVEMLREIETIRVKSGHLVKLQQKLSHNAKTASTITSELQKILNEFDYRQNFIVAIVLNLIFLWDIRCIVRLYRWQQNYAGDLARWFDVIAEMDALVSLANCNYNHPEWATPTVSSSEFHFSAENMGHPLIDEKRCVRNSFQLTNDEQIVIITGANMAGKSTFLRTIGINLVLASNGCKVCADSFTFSPIRIYTNMRTTDNLMSDESYFYAELLRLQAMLNHIRSGEKLFVVIDEMLKGTNSTDKLNGSKELVHQLVALKTHGIVATHDLNLTELALIYPSAIKNRCFEVQLSSDELIFDYKLTDGVTRTMNATFLMKKMGIIPKD